MKRLSFLIFIIGLFFTQALYASERKEEGVGLTIYSTPTKGSYYTQTQPGFAIIKEWRRLFLKKGINTTSFQDVAKLIDPSTVSFKSLTDPEGTKVIEQNYEYDLVGRQKLLEKYIDQEIFLEHEYEETQEVVRRKGKLLSTTGGTVVEMDGEIHLDPKGRIILPSLKEGLITKPTLVWLIQAKRSGEHLAKVTYETKGIGWNADYIAVVKESDQALDLSGWVTIDNKSGATYQDAELKLVAGDIHRVAPPGRVHEPMRYLTKAMAEKEEVGFVEKPFFEYHLYTLRQKTTLKDNSMKQLSLFDPASGVPVQKILLYYGHIGPYYFYSSPAMDRELGTRCNKKVDIYLTFKNAKSSNLGIPLPAGRVRVYKEDPDDASLEFIGEDWIDHTPKDEEVKLKLGCAFDVVGERKQTDFKVEYHHHWMEESFEINLRNHKDEAVEVIVKENLFRWVNWEIKKSSHPYEKIDSRTIHFKVRVAKDEEKKITYTVRYTW